ncbi:MAG: PD-(D/E)XK nuclease family protein [Deltaproteobacteria bacterium]|nr:PD-(D/E)XK nuclease family protein [Deltaproteobacteria bacterium]
MPSWGKAQVLLGRGALAIEHALLAELCAELDTAAANPASLSSPLRVVVPSASLRDHLCSRLVAQAGRPLLGVRVQTLHATALEILAGSDVPPPRGECLFPVFVERAARAEPCLRQPLEDLQDGFGGVTASASDLLDAGLEPAHAAALGDALADAGGDTAPRERAAAIVRTALAAAGSMRAAGAGRGADLLRDAAQRLQEEGTAALPSRGVVVHGFAEATGRGLDLLDALVRHCDARVFVDAPARPGRPEEEDPGAAFARRLRERLEASAGPGELLQGSEPPAALQLVRAPGAQAECREVASRVRTLLDAGTTPERIGVVARTLSAYAVPLRAQLGRLAVPFSGCGAWGPAAPSGRKLRGLIELLGRGGDLPVDRWLDLAGGERDLSVGLHALGAGRLGDVARLDAGAALGSRGSLPLPVRRGLDDESGVERARRRTLSGERLRRAVKRAAATLDRLERWRSLRRPSDHLAALRELARAGLSWQGETRGALEALAAGLEEELPAAAPLGLSEFARVLAARVDDACGTPLGGEGAGVQVLDVTEARARSFEHLFVLGMNRDVFPRSVAEDPLLPDTLRRPLAAVLPDLPIKQTAHGEESYLFAQLLSASPAVTLSWLRVDDDGRPRAASPFIEGLRLALRAQGSEPPVFEAPVLYEPRDPEALRPALEHAIQAGLSGSREDFTQTLVTALGSDDALAQARVAVLDELDPAARAAPRLGPYYGFLGSGAVDGGDERTPLFVTTLEGFAGCPWQAFLRKVLRIEPLPDALEALPALDPRMVGILVHRVIERIVQRAHGGSEEPRALEEAKDAIEVEWPDPDALEARIEEAAEEVLREEGVGFAALKLLLVETARPLVATARRRLWPETGPLRLVGSELQGELQLGAGRALGFRADLIEQRLEGPRLTDVKTGRSISQAKQPKTRLNHLRKAIASGQKLQGAVYQLGGGPDATGRYVFVGAETADECAEFSIQPGDAELIATARRVLDGLFDGWDAGVFFPRLLGDNDAEPQRCGYCELSQACLRGDSGARARLRAWVGAGTARLPAEQQLLELWRLAGGTGGGAGT